MERVGRSAVLEGPSISPNKVALKNSGPREEGRGVTFRVAANGPNGLTGRSTRQ